MTEKVRRWIEKENLIQPGDLVLVGVSGGADSVCLLTLLLSLKERMGFSLGAVHVEHGIRGIESEEDAAFVEELCERAGIFCRVYHVDARARAEEEGIGMEEAARGLRYECYLKEAEQAGAPRVKIAVAHHANDNAETILFQMARGSGLQGLCGMPVQRLLTDNVWLIRPLLAVTRAEIEEYLCAQGQQFRTDETNMDVRYSRNRIRHAVIPQLSVVNSQAAWHISRSAVWLSDLRDYLDREVEKIWPTVCTRQDENTGCMLRDELFVQYHRALVQRVVQRALELTAGSGKDLAGSHVEAVMRLADSQVGRRICLPDGLTASRVYGGICICENRKMEAAAGTEPSHAVRITAEQIDGIKHGEWLAVSLPDGQMRMRVRPFSGKIEEIPKKKYTKWLNYDKIKCDLWIRKRISGDYITIDADGHTKKLKEYFIGEKIPAERREDIWLLADQSHVLWVVGGRISADCRVEPHTEKVLEIQMRGGNYLEDQED